MLIFVKFKSCIVIILGAWFSTFLTVLSYQWFN